MLPYTSREVVQEGAVSFLGDWAVGAKCWGYRVVGAGGRVRVRFCSEFQICV